MELGWNSGPCAWEESALLLSHLVRLGHQYLSQTHSHCYANNKTLEAFIVEVYRQAATDGDS